eukprot:7305273-Alexandrium_andersonii.AAC.1
MAVLYTGPPRWKRMFPRPHQQSNVDGPCGLPPFESAMAAKGSRRDRQLAERKQGPRTRPPQPC